MLARLRIVCVLLCVATVASFAASRADSGDDASSSLHIPLAVTFYRGHPSSVRVDVGVGNLPLRSMQFDTGSTGLHVFSAARLDTPGSGIRCSDTPTQTSYGHVA